MNLRVPSRLAAAALCLVAGSVFSTSSRSSPGAAQSAGRGLDEWSQSLLSDVRTGLVTLWARDPLARSISLDDGLPGSILRDHKLWNRWSHLDFGGLCENELTAGVQGREEAAWVDLGNRAELAARYRYEETVGWGQGFASIHREDGQLVILADYQAQSYQLLREAEQLFAETRSSASALVREDHVYLLRLSDGDGSAERLFKLLVLAFHPGESVTLRWVEID